tara:strand:- start:9753 stop:10334 length:582 start_codon:yes stop_codon:yes gene_type:complete
MADETEAFNIFQNAEIDFADVSDMTIIKFLDAVKTSYVDNGYEVSMWDKTTIPVKKISGAIADEEPFVYVGIMGGDSFESKIESLIVSYLEVNYDGENCQIINDVGIGSSLNELTSLLEPRNVDKSGIFDEMDIQITTQPAVGEDNMRKAINTTSYDYGLIAIGGTNFKMPKPINWLNKFPIASKIRQKLKNM